MNSRNKLQCDSPISRFRPGFLCTAFALAVAWHTSTVGVQADPSVLISYDFNNCALPAGASVNGAARVAGDGVGGNCFIHLTDTNQCSTNGTFAFSNPATNLNRLHAHWRSRVGGDAGTVCNVTQFERPGAGWLQFQLGRGRGHERRR